MIIPIMKSKINATGMKTRIIRPMMPPDNPVQVVPKGHKVFIYHVDKKEVIEKEEFEKMTEVERQENIVMFYALNYKNFLRKLAKVKITKVPAPKENT